MAVSISQQTRAQHVAASAMNPSVRWLLSEQIARKPEATEDVDGGMCDYGGEQRAVEEKRGRQQQTEQRGTQSTRGLLICVHHPKRTCAQQHGERHEPR